MTEQQQEEIDDLNYELALMLGYRKCRYHGALIGPWQIETDNAYCGCTDGVPDFCHERSTPSELLHRARSVKTIKTACEAVKAILEQESETNNHD